MSATDDVSGNGRLAFASTSAMLAFGVCSDTGDVRPHNEDYAAAYVPDGDHDDWDRGPLFVVADGLGGHAAGEVASRLAVETTLATWTAPTPEGPQQALRSAVRSANHAILDHSLEEGRHGMGTTLTALTLAGREAVIAHVGDSRAYVVRDDNCTQLTNDHSRVGDMLRMRLITPEQAINHPARSQLTRSLGADLAVQLDLVRHAAHTGDVFVLCTDGLWEIIARHEIAAAVETYHPHDAADALVTTAVKRGATDNVTAVVVRLLSDVAVPAAAAKRSFFRRGR